MILPPDFTAEDRMAAGWILRMAEGEVADLDALYRLYHRPLLGLFGAILKDDFAAEEVLQDTFLRAFGQAGRFDPELGTPFTWLATIGKRMAIDRLRRRRTQPVIQAESMEQPEISGDNYSGDIHERAHRSLEAQWVRDCFSDLSEAQQEVIDLAFLQGYTHQEIAEMLKKPLGTVKSDLYRGLTQLRKAYLDGND